MCFDRNEFLILYYNFVESTLQIFKQYELCLVNEWDLKKNDESRLSSQHVIWNILVFPIPTCACRCFSSIHRNGCSIFYLWFFYRLFSYPSFTSAKVFYHSNFGKRGEQSLSLSLSLSLWFSLIVTFCVGTGIELRTIGNDIFA